MAAPVFDELIGQVELADTLSAAASDSAVGLTHAWLFTGPPGSGRSTAALAFAAALECPRGGCGDCSVCHTVLGGTHSDVTRVIPEGLSIGVDSVRRLIQGASRTPTSAPWRVLIVEDADRLTEAAGNALLKAIEEPPRATVFLLCAPSDNPAEISITIRSRCRHKALRQPPVAAVSRLLMERDGVSEREARLYAGATSGHIGRARRLATDPTAQARRDAVLAIPRSLSGLSACFTAAAELVETAEAEAADSYAEQSDQERADLETALGKGGTGKGATKAARGSAGALKDLEKKQKTRDTRAQRDSLDRALVDLADFYRDALVTRLGAPVRLVHTDVSDVTRAAATKMSPEALLRRINAIMDCRRSLARNVRPRIAVEAMMCKLWRSLHYYSVCGAT
ncbi:DNA polymerase III subunit delta' [Haloglycomyces albus]|uniref:DNA polymerase III subunit delta' n=1 Tax=Haloglycomyces albus TaxID=526067 RepID=UPI00046D65AD|nr:DNA polymerase III subunit delta' [Haloglycomyces albus]